MTQEIKITAEVDKVDANVCKFTADRPLHAGKLTLQRGGPSQGNALVEALFSIEEVAAVSIFGPIVLVTKKAGRDWRMLGKEIGTAIRTFLHGGHGPSQDQMQRVTGNSDQLRRRVQELFDIQINPNVASHGGYVELIDVKDNNVYLRMGGGCQGCGMANVTLKQGIETLIHDQVPEVWQVLDVTDHAGGANPYYEPAK